MLRFCRLLFPALATVVATGCTFLYDTDDLVEVDAGVVAPVLSEIIPPRAERGTGELVAVTLVGESFTPSTTATFGGQAVSATYVSSTELSVEVPNDVGFGPIPVVVESQGGSDSLESAFALFTTTVTLGTPVQQQLTGGADWAAWRAGQVTDLVYGQVAGDEQLDLLVLLNGNNPGLSGRLMILEGQGQGAFTAVGGVDTAGADNRAVVIANLNDDDFPDLVVGRVCCDGTTGDAFIGSDVGFSALALTPPEAVAGESAGTIGVVNVDYDGSGSDDLVVLRSTSVGLEQIQLFSYGASVFTAAPPYEAAPGSGPDNAAELFTFSEGLGREKGNLLVSADFDGDGFPDLVAPIAKLNGTDTTALAMARGSAAGPVYPPEIRTFTDVPAGGIASMAVADVNRDGLPDLVVAPRGENQLWTLFGDGAGGFQLQSAAISLTASELVLTDANGDGFLDAWVCDREPAARGSNIAISLHLGREAGGFVSASAKVIDVQAPTVNDQLSCGGLVADDFDGDGINDLAAVVVDETVMGGEIEVELRVYENVSDG